MGLLIFLVELAMPAVVLGCRLLLGRVPISALGLELPGWAAHSAAGNNVEVWRMYSRVG